MISALYLMVRRVAEKVLRVTGFRAPQNHLEYSGPFETWDLAVLASAGYDSPVALKKVEEAVLKVIAGKAKYERDGTTFRYFPKNDTARQLLHEILNENSVIINFGGGLGGNYLANQSLLDKKNITYIIIEQSSFVNQGKLIANECNLPIQFIESIWESPLKNVKMLVCSSVLQYVEEWQNVVSDLLACKPQYILIDRMSLTDGPTSILVQENEGYYNPKVSYPVRILNREEFLRKFEGYTIIQEWESDFDPPNHLGFLLVNKKVLG